ncbi:MAG TPA: hypothetical protein PK018_09410 [Candidatus Competibacter sp.]|nr:hypothetical protein [Candidatus Competibacteraceae bacterium]HPE72372.1 hypothetical protein [Candidatus Competibacter sp.]
MNGNGTSTRRGEIGLGDLAVALATLDIATETHLRGLGRCLGLGGLSLGSVGTLKVAADPRWRHRRPPPQSPEPQAPTGLPPLPPPPPGPPAEFLETVMASLPPVEPSDAPWPDGRTQPARVAAKAAAPPREPLFPRRTAPGVLGAAIATLRPGPRPDLDRLIAHVVRGRPFREIPRLPMPSQSRGVQVLLDRNESMTPFFADQIDLAHAFIRVAGSPRCAVFEFLEDPAAAGACSAADPPVAWRPQPGRPVVVVTDFGLGDSSGSAPRLPQQTWRRFAVRLKRHRCPLLAVVPRAPAEWPRWVERHFIALHWDPRTRAGPANAPTWPAGSRAPCHPCTAPPKAIAKVAGWRSLRGPRWATPAWFCTASPSVQTRCRLGSAPRYPRAPACRSACAWGATAIV